MVAVSKVTKAKCIIPIAVGLVTNKNYEYGDSWKNCSCNDNTIQCLRRFTLRAISRLVDFYLAAGVKKGNLFYLI